MIFGANVIRPEIGKNSDNPWAGLFTPFHEIAQINIAKKLYEKHGIQPELEKSLKTKVDGKSKKYEADIVLGNKVWEVKPLNGADPKPQLELYKKIGDLTEGEQLSDIEGINVFGNVKMNITFPSKGEAYYSFVYQENNGSLTELKTAAAAAIIFRELLKALPAGRRAAPGF